MSFREDLIKLAYDKPHLREDILPLLYPKNLKIASPSFIEVNTSDDQIIVGFEIDRQADLSWLKNINNHNLLDDFSRAVCSKTGRDVSFQENSREYIGRGLIKIKGTIESFDQNLNHKSSFCKESLESDIRKVAPKAVITFQTKE